jgi:cellulose synthase/poly-beta-1,6-N-acetylglucosamine synthase-like glycosyltransferase
MMVGVAAVKITFWVCLALVIYPYLVYPLLLFVAYSLTQAWRDLRYLVQGRSRRTETPATHALPAISLLIPAYNEERALLQKMENLRQLDFPRERMQIIFVSDGSIDDTNAILESIADANVECVLLPERKGKANALNQAVARARNPILVFCDASTLFRPDAIHKLVRHFSDPTVGGVCGAVAYEANAVAQQTEGLYWKYESMLRGMEARLGAILNASGAIYALRRACYPRLPVTTIIEDFVIPMNARKLGYSMLYDPEAIALEFPASSVSGEFTRRVRLAMGSFRAIGGLIRVPWRGFTPFALVSHKLMRWAVPFFLIGLLLSNLALSGAWFYRIVLLVQIIFYVWAGLGFFFYSTMRRIRYGLVAYFWAALHLAFLVGFIRCLLDSEKPVWQKVS